MQNDSYLYETHFPHGKYTHQYYDDALEYAKKNNGYCIMAKSKDLFPHYKMVWSNFQPSFCYWFIIHLKEVRQ